MRKNGGSEKVRITLDLNKKDYEEFDQHCQKNGSKRTKSKILRKAIKIILALEKGELFLSTSSKCEGKIPISVL